MPLTGSAPFNKTFATFGRMWSAGMVPIIEKSGGWPGFRYTPEEEAGMRDQASRLPNANGRFLLFGFVNAPIAIAVSLVALGAMSIRITTLWYYYGRNRKSSE